MRGGGDLKNVCKSSGGVFVVVVVNAQQLLDLARVMLSLNNTVNYTRLYSYELEMPCKKREAGADNCLAQMRHAEFLRG